MKPQLELLSTIKKVQPDPALYAAIKQRIKNKTEQSLPWAFLRAAAAIFVIMVAAQLYFNHKNTFSESEDIYASVAVNSNTLYDEY